MWLMTWPHVIGYSARGPLSPGTTSRAAARMRPRRTVTYNVGYSMRGGGQRNCTAGTRWRRRWRRNRRRQDRGTGGKGKRAYGKSERPRCRPGVGTTRLRFSVKRSPDTALRYGVAILAVGAAVLVKWWLDPLTVQDTPFLLILGAIVIGAWYGGLGPGLLATALSALAIDYLFLVPRVSFATVGPELLDLGAFVVEGILVCVLTAS